MKPSTSNPQIDCSTADAERFELCPSHYSVLSPRDPSDHLIDLGAFCIHAMQKAPTAKVSPPVAVGDRGGCGS
jgi:hypothetical protein